MKPLKRKYPRTWHLPFSLGITRDDKIHTDISFFEKREIVISEKMDGESCTMMNDSIFARSVDSADHPSRHWVKGLWGSFRHDIPDGWKICGENLYATHSLHYTNLSSYFMVFSIWDENDICLSWDDTVTLCDYLRLDTVPVLWRGVFNEEHIKSFKVDTEKQEGFVVRVAEAFPFEDFDKCVAKWVRKGHVTSDEHWMYKKIIPNELKPLK